MSHTEALGGSHLGSARVRKSERGSILNPRMIHAAFSLQATLFPSPHCVLHAHTRRSNGWNMVVFLPSVWPRPKIRMTHVGNLFISAQSAEFALNGDSQSWSGTPRRCGAPQEVPTVAVVTVTESNLCIPVNASSPSARLMGKRLRLKAPIRAVSPSNMAPTWEGLTPTSLALNYT